jgi:hypothetical protein
VPDKAVVDDASADVVVIQPGLALTKSVSAQVVRAGDTVQYTIEVENTGDVDLELTGITDDKCASLIFDDASDTDGDGRLDGANSTPETWRWTCSRVIDSPAPEPADVNTASVTGVDPLGNTYEDSDTASVRVVEPAIDLVKSVNKLLVPAGTPVDYTFLVTNVGTSDIPAEDVLADVDLRDAATPALPVCSEPVLIAKEGGNQDDLLEREPAEVWRYGCTAPIEADTVNLAVVTATGGQPVGLEFRVADFDVAEVAVFHPGIEVTKSASPTRIEGSGRVTYTYRVRNTGDVPLADVRGRISDDTCSPVRYASGDTDDDGLLDTPTSIFEDAADEVWVFRCTTTLSETTTNVVTVDGSPSGPDGLPLCGPDALPVLVQEPCDVSDDDRARVVVEDKGGGGGRDDGDGDEDAGDETEPGAQGGESPGGLLPDTGAAPWLRELLLLALLMIAGGAGLIARARHEMR